MLPFRFDIALETVESHSCITCVVVFAVLDRASMALHLLPHTPVLTSGPGCLALTNSYGRA